MKAPVPEPIEREYLRALTETFYDQQKTRQEAANRCRAIIRSQLEELERKPEGKKKKADKSYGAEWNDKRMLQKLNKAFEEKKITSESHAYAAEFLNLKKSLEKLESDYEKMIVAHIKNEPIYTEYLKHIKGIGPVLAANLIAYLGYCENFDTPSKIWRYSGLAVIDGKAERKARGEKIHFNPRVKTLAWKVGDCFIKVGVGYREVYDASKAGYLAAHPEPIPRPGYDGKGFKESYTKMHIHLMSMRKSVKRFLSHYWQVGRAMKGLPCRPSYVEEKMGHTTIMPPFIEVFDEMEVDTAGLPDFVEIRTITKKKRKVVEPTQV